MIILFNPQSAPPGKTYLPLSLLALGAFLEDRYPYEIIDGNLLPDPTNHIIERVRQTDAKVLGVTVMPGPQLKQAVEVCRKVREVLPTLPIVWGGYFPTEHPDVCLKSSYVDYIVKSQGEQTFIELLELLMRPGGERPGAIELSKIAGIAFKRGDLIQHTRERSLISPQQLPPMPYHRVPMERYLIETAVGKRTLPHNSSYGCPFLCNFCAVVKMVNGGWLAQTGEQTAASVRHLHDKYGADSIIFVDNNFFTSEKRVRHFAESLLRDGPVLPWWGEGRIDTLLKYKPETWELMQKAGCDMIFMGAESGSDETLAQMNKGGKASTAATLEMAELMKRYDIVPEFSFIMGNPPNPDADIENTINFIKKVKTINSATEIILYLYSPEPVEGDMLEAAQSGGFRFPTSLEQWVGDEWGDFAHRHDPHTPWLRPAHRRRVTDFGQVLNARFPTSTNPRMAGWRGKVVQAAASWRYQSGFYRWPYELTLLDRLLAYQRQDTRAC